MTEGSKRPAGERRGSPQRQEGLAIGATAVVAYAAFAAVMMFDDSGRVRGKANAGVPVDAVRAIVAAADANAGDDRSSRPAVGVGQVIPEPRRAAEAVNSSVGVRTRSLGAATADIARATDGLVGSATGDGGLKLQFLVKFEEAEATSWRDRFLADPNGARAEWSRFASSNAAFAGLRLERMNYSGEATLEFDGSAPTSQAAAQELSDDIVRRLKAADGVEYAEPNLVGVREGVQ